jgi:SAM-dependent methyltransferase
MGQPDFKDHFSPIAASYAAHRPLYPAALVDYLADAATQRDVAWDAGCGSGQLSVLLAARFARVIATDPSSEQLAQARQESGVEYRQASAEASGLPAASVDLAVAAQAAHWFDLPRYYDEVRRVVRRGGLITLLTYGVIHIEKDVDPAIERFYWQTLAGLWPPERSLVEAGYQSLAFPFVEMRTPRFEMTASWTLPQVLGYVRTWSAVQALERAGRGAEYTGFARALSASWGDAAKRRVVRWDLALRVGRVDA